MVIIEWNNAFYKDWNFYLAIIAMSSLIITVVNLTLRIARENKLKANNIFERLYELTFGLRNEISTIMAYDWYYEFNLLVIHNSNANESILLYLNTVNNIFASVGKSWFFNKQLSRLIPIKLFNRLIALTPYINYYRKQDNDASKFEDYIKFIEFCCNIRSIKTRYYDMHHYLWVGIRESDVAYNDSVERAISVFDAKTSYRIRPNQNTSDIIQDFEKKIGCLNKKKIAHLYTMFYNAQWPYIFKLIKLPHPVCINSSTLLDFLNNKFSVRQYMQSLGINCIPSFVVNGRALTKNHLTILLGNKSWVIQELNGSGGYSTWHICENSFEHSFKSTINPLKDYLVSKYYDHNISINSTIIVSNKQTVVFPASIQIIEEHDNRLHYRGNDFIAFRDLKDDIKTKVLKQSLNVANGLRDKGYLGIAGIDFIVVEDDVLLCEINPRFQASSVVLSKYLKDKFEQNNGNTINARIKNKRKSHMNTYCSYESFDLLRLNENAFNGMINTTVNFYDEINYSCYYYYKDNNEDEDINYKLSLLGQYADKDGFSASCKTDSNSYLFRAIIAKRICQISPDNTLWISDNIKINHLPQKKIELKIALLNQGIRLNQHNHYKEAVFEAVDCYIEKDDLYVNSPTKSPLISYSPFSIVNTSAGDFLFFNGKQYSKINVEKNQIDFSLQERECLYISTDRLRINPILGCEYKSIGKGCKFCEFRNKYREFSLEDLEKAYDYARTLRFHHIMIGGGTVLNNRNEGAILEFVRYIKSKTPDKKITYMGIPVSANKLLSYKEAGIDEVSFNIEIVDEIRSKELMPAKSAYSRSHYINTLAQSTRIWQGYGNVRSIIVVGFDKYADIIRMVKKLDISGVQPVLSVFRPLEGSDLPQCIPPSNDYLLKLYVECSQIINPHSLGPECKACQNNTLAL